MKSLRYLSCCLFAASTLLSSCDQSDPVEEQLLIPIPELDPESSYGISEIRAYSSDQKILVDWRTYSGPIDLGPHIPPIMNTRLLMSTSDEASDYEEVHIGEVEGADSVELTELPNGIPHYFKLEIYGFDGQKIGTSQPICAIPGTLPVEILSFQITEPTEAANTNLAWSPDGSEIAFIDIDNSGYKNIHILNRNTLSLEVVTKHEAEEVSDVSWSPNGQYLAYTLSATLTSRDADFRIWLLDLMTLETWQISSGPVDFDPEWISDTQLVFAKGSKGPPNIPELMLLNPEDGSESVLTQDGSLYKYVPNVRPGTNEILFSGIRSGTSNYNIYTPSADGGDSELMLADFWSSTNPKWLPNSEKIIFSSNRTGENEIWSMSLPDGTFEQKTRGNVGSSRDVPTITRDGKLLAYIELRADYRAFLKVIELD